MLLAQIYWILNPEASNLSLQLLLLLPGTSFATVAHALSPNFATAWRSSSSSCSSVECDKGVLLGFARSARLPTSSLLDAVAYVHAWDSQCLSVQLARTWIAVAAHSCLKSRLSGFELTCSVQAERLWAVLKCMVPRHASKLCQVLGSS